MLKIITLSFIAFTIFLQGGLLHLGQQRGELELVPNLELKLGKICLHLNPLMTVILTVDLFHKGRRLKRKSGENAFVTQLFVSGIFVKTWNVHIYKFLVSDPVP